MEEALASIDLKNTNIGIILKNIDKLYEQVLKSGKSLDTMIKITDTSFKNTEKDFEKLGISKYVDGMEKYIREIEKLEEELCLNKKFDDEDKYIRFPHADFVFLAIKYLKKKNVKEVSKFNWLYDSAIKKLKNGWKGTNKDLKFLKNFIENKDKLLNLLNNYIDDPEYKAIFDKIKRQDAIRQLDNMVISEGCISLIYCINDEIKNKTHLTQLKEQGVIIEKYVQKYEKLTNALLSISSLLRKINDDLKEDVDQNRKIYLSLIKKRVDKLIDSEISKKPYIQILDYLLGKYPTVDKEFIIKIVGSAVNLPFRDFKRRYHPLFKKDGINMKEIFEKLRKCEENNGYTIILGYLIKKSNEDEIDKIFKKSFISSKYLEKRMENFLAVLFPKEDYKVYGAYRKILEMERNIEELNKKIDDYKIRINEYKMMKVINKYQKALEKLEKMKKKLKRNTSAKY